MPDPSKIIAEFEVKRHNGQCPYGEWIPLPEAPQGLWEEVVGQVLKTDDDYGEAEVGGQKWVFRRSERLAASADLGRRIGEAMARDVLAEGMPREWTGLDPQDLERYHDGLDFDVVTEHAFAAYTGIIGKTNK